MLTGCDGCIETIASLHRAGEEKPIERNKKGCFRHFKKYCRVSFMLTGCDGRSFAARALRLWNALPVDIKNSESLNIFKSKVRRLLFR